MTRYRRKKTDHQLHYLSGNTGTNHEHVWEWPCVWLKVQKKVSDQNIPETHTPSKVVLRVLQTVKIQTRGSESQHLQLLCLE
jgi:hypothetical protein